VSAKEFVSWPSEDKIKAFLPELEKMMGSGLVTLEKVQVLQYGENHEHRGGRPSHCRAADERNPDDAPNRGGRDRNAEGLRGRFTAHCGARG